MKMKSKVKQAIKNIYSLMKKESKLNVKSVQQHIHDFKNKKDHYMKHDFSAYTHITPLRAAINYVQNKKQCTWCANAADIVQASLQNDLYEKEYKISGLCGKCQDEIFTSSVDESLPQHHNIQLNQIVCNSEEVPY
tara:strand:+ start:199 stop:606 length:408 start_codon:yes stop_codon:yes gene_type:complete